MSSDNILNGAKKWFSDVIVVNHIKNTQKLSNAAEFKINHFTIGYLTNFLGGSATPKNIARALIYPRALGTSITTSFGQNLQSFITVALEAYGSTTSGIDIEFIDAIDGRKKYCQLKAGPQTINKDDVDTIHDHFSSVRNLARTNSLQITDSDLIVGILYGEKSELSANYKNIEKKHFHPVHIGEDLWHRLTGEKIFYNKLIKTFRDLAVEFDGTDILEKTIEKLSETDEIKDIHRHLS
jgi:hypothetical protein